MEKLPSKEALDFSLRLKKALKRSPKKADTPAELAVQFNLRYSGDPITPQAAQKWLSGTARPTIDKIETLATWLNVSTQWLRYGIPEDRPIIAAGKKSLKGRGIAVQPTEAEIKLLAKIRSLPEHRRHLVTEIVDEFSLEQEMWRE